MDPRALPEHDAGQRLSAARRGHSVAQSPRRPAPPRSHDRSLGHQHHRKEEYPQAPRPEPSHARTPVASKPQGLRRGNKQEPPDEGSPPRLASIDAPSPQSRAARRGNKPPHRPSSPA